MLNDAYYLSTKKNSLDVKNRSIFFFLRFFLSDSIKIKSSVFFVINNYRATEILKIDSQIDWIFIFHFSRIMNVFSLFGVL